MLAICTFYIYRNYVPVSFPTIPHFPPCSFHSSCQLPVAPLLPWYLVPRGGGCFCGERQHGGFYITPPPFSLAKFLGKSRVFT